MVFLDTDIIDFPLKYSVYLYFRIDFSESNFLARENEQLSANTLVNEKTKAWKHLPVKHKEKNNA